MKERHRQPDSLTAPLARPPARDEHRSTRQPCDRDRTFGAAPRGCVSRLSSGNRAPRACGSRSTERRLRHEPHRRAGAVGRRHRHRLAFSVSPRARPDREPLRANGAVSRQAHRSRRTCRVARESASPSNGCHSLTHLVRARKRHLGADRRPRAEHARRDRRVEQEAPSWKLSGSRAHSPTRAETTSVSSARRSTRPRSASPIALSTASACARWSRRARARTTARRDTRRAGSKRGLLPLVARRCADLQRSSSVHAFTRLRRSHSSSRSLRLRDALDPRGVSESPRRPSPGRGSRRHRPDDAAQIVFVSARAEGATGLTPGLISPL